MQHRNKLLLTTAAAVALWSASTTASFAMQRLLLCPCTDPKVCKLQSGREEMPFVYDETKKKDAAFDAIEAQAMQQADADAVDAANAALAKDAGLKCPQPCDPQPALSIQHGPPFAAASNGTGAGRSLWEVDYVCKKTPQEPNSVPYNPGPGGGGVRPPDGGGNDGPVIPVGPVGPNIPIPPVPKCFGLGADKDELIDQLKQMRKQQALAGPLGAEPDDPAEIQHQANMKAINDALDQAEHTDLCDPGLLGGVHIGIGIGLGGGHDHDDRYRDDRHRGDDHVRSHDDHPKTGHTDKPKTDTGKTDTGTDRPKAGDGGKTDGHGTETGNGDPQSQTGGDDSDYQKPPHH